MEIIKKHAPEEIEAIEYRLGNIPLPTNRRTDIIIRHLLHPYYKVDGNKTKIDEYLRSVDEMFSRGFGIFSLRSIYDGKMGELETMLKEMPKYNM